MLVECMVLMNGITSSVPNDVAQINFLYVTASTDII